MMLKVFIYEKKLFSLSFLNNRIANFSYGREESRNKVPKPIERHHVTSPESRLHLSGMFKHVSGIVHTFCKCVLIPFPLISATQAWTLSTYLPLMIGDKVPFDDQYWDCYLLLLEITKYCTARSTSVPSATYVASLIEQHHRAFRVCYPHVNMTPKLHYMVHFPRQLKL